VKNKIAKFCGFTFTCNIALVYAGIILKDDNTLREYNIVKDKYIHIVSGIK
jgi:hypothetical protein